MSCLRSEVLAGTWQEARHPHRRDTGQLGTGRVELQVPCVGELLGQPDTELIAQGIDQDIGDTAAAFMQFRGHQTIKHIRIGQPSAGRPAAHFQMLGKEDLYLGGQTTVARRACSITPAMISCASMASPTACSNSRCKRSTSRRLAR